MIDSIKKLWVLCALAALAAGAFAQGSTDLERLGPKGPTINDRAELMRYVADESESNPIAKLSTGARQRLLANSLYSPSGQIKSLYFTEIVDELRPADAYPVFAMFAFGFPCASMIATHGPTSTGRDRSILEKVCRMPSEKSAMSCAYEGYYCNAGHCTANRQFLCSPSSCAPR
jgi:hypothetical protein